ncbi:MAG: TVP38/TMEM64 family protein [Candidatus Omnitrophica bacterium]|nr:TVP38/TMEM64 family protein [Candidatus Omnitrophota bacterium]
MKRNPLLKLLIGIVVLVAIFMLVRSLHIDFSNITPEKFKETIEGFGIWGPVIYIVFYILRPLIFFPAALLSASAGVIWGVKGLIYLLIAANLSAVGEFLISRYLARGAVEKLIKGKMGNIDEAIERRGFVTVLLIRLIPNLPWDIQNLGLGLTKVKFRDYFWATFIGIVPGSFVLVYFGSSFMSVLTNPKNIWKVGLAVLLFAFVYWLQKFLKDKRKEMV